MSRAPFRALLGILLLLASVLLLGWRADAVDVATPAAGGQVPYGPTVTFTGTGKPASSRLLLWDGTAYAGCLSETGYESSGDWTCTVDGPWLPGAHALQVGAFDRDGNPVGDSVPVSFSVVSVLDVDAATLSVTRDQQLRITGRADQVGAVAGVITRPGTDVRVPLTCRVGAGTFACVLPTETADDRAVAAAGLPVASDYRVSVTESDSRYGQVAQLSRRLAVVAPPARPQPPTTPPVPGAPGAPGSTPTPTGTPTTVPPTAAPVLPKLLASFPGSVPIIGSAPLRVIMSGELQAPVLTSPEEVAPVVVSSPLLPTEAPDLGALVGVLVAAFAALTLAGGQGLATLRPVSATGSPLPSRSRGGAAGWGDRSRSWRLPGHRAVDRFGRQQSERLARRSPLLGRVVADAAYLRSMLGVGALVPTLLATGLGLAAVVDVGGRPLPPSTALVAALVVLACLDAVAGATAVAVFSLGVVLTGGLVDGKAPDLAGSLSVLLVLALLWTAVPLIGAATRPFRRRPVAAAFAATLCGWIAFELVHVLAPLAGTDLRISDDALAVGIATAAGVVLRILLEETADRGYPVRLGRVGQSHELPAPARLTRLGGALTRSAVLGLLAAVLLGGCWQLWVGWALVAAVQVGAVFEDRLPEVRVLARVLPRGLGQLLVVLPVLVVGAAGATTGAVDVEDLRNCFVIMALPWSLITAAGLFGLNRR